MTKEQAIEEAKKPVSIFRTVSTEYILMAQPGERLTRLTDVRMLCSGKGMKFI